MKKILLSGAFIAVSVFGSSCSNLADKSAPTTPTIPIVVHKVASGASYTCALLSDNSVQCLGLGTSGQIGNGTTSSTAAVVVSGFAGTVASIFSGQSTSCAILTTGAVQCWGQGTEGELGGTTNSSTPVTIAGLPASPVINLAMGNGFVCAQLQSGAVYCWGDNTNGELGNGTNTASAAPVLVQGLSSGVTGLSAGGATVCATMSTGSVNCWGAGTSGQLGNGASTDSNVPVAATGISTATEVSVGSSQSCAVLQNLTMVCWGSGTLGQLGTGSTTSSSTPVAASAFATGILNVTATGDSTCVEYATGSVACVGANNYGQLGNGTTSATATTTPQTITGLTSVGDFSGSSDHECVLVTIDNYKCWGRNNQGQLGDGTTTDSSTPVAASGFGLVTTATPSPSTTASASPTPTSTPSATSTPDATYTVTPSGSFVMYSPLDDSTVNAGATQTYTNVMALGGETLASTVGGTCPAGSWSGSSYTTGAITSNCTVIFQTKFTVTPSGTNVTPAPSSATYVNQGATLAITVTPSGGYANSATVTGTCAAGSWNGSVYTTGAVTANCTVEFSGVVSGGKIIFSTTESHTGNFGGTAGAAIANADAFCNASTESLLYGGTYKALLVSSARKLDTDWPFAASQTYTDVARTHIIFTTTADKKVAFPFSPTIGFDSGVYNSSWVGLKCTLGSCEWTVNAYNCTNWTSADPGVQGSLGWFNNTNESAFDFQPSVELTYACNSGLRMICIQQ